jgi:hypothetical protein
MTQIFRLGTFLSLSFVIFDYMKEGQHIHWFELKDGAFIGVSDVAIIQSKHLIVSDTIDENAGNQKVFTISHFPNGLELMFYIKRAEVRLDGYQFRFADARNMNDFQKELQKRFPRTHDVSGRRTFFQVARAPLMAIIVLVVLFLVGMASTPGNIRGNRGSEALFVLLASIPKPLLAACCLLLIGVAIYNAQRLWKNYEATEILLVKIN